MRLASIAVVLACSLLASQPAFATKQQLTIVLGGLDNPFFEDMAAGCAQWTKDHADSDYECVAVGPKQSAKAADEAKLLETAISGGSAAIAIAPATPGLPDVIKKSATTIPIMTVDGDFATADQALRKTWLTTDAYQVGVSLAGLVIKAKPKGGTVCLEQNNPDALDINARAAGVRDTLGGKTGVTALAGDNGWTEVAGCPLYNKNDLATADKQLTQVLKDNPKLDAVILVGGWAMFDAKAYGKAIAKAKARLKDGSLVIVSGDTLPMQLDALKAGQVQGLIGQKPFALGLMAPDVMIKLIKGEAVDPKIAADMAVCTPDNVATCTAH